MIRKLQNIRPRSTVAQKQVSLLAVICLLIGVFSVLSPHFLTLKNFQTILRNMPELGLLSVGMSIVMMTGGIDISAEAALGVAAILVGKSMLQGDPAWVSALIGPITGGILGTINGVVVAYFGVLPIIVTLGAMYVWRAVIFLLVGARWLSGLPRTFDPLVKTFVLGIPIPFIFFLLITMSLEFLFRKTPFGWHILAIGNSEYSARLAGVRTRRVTVGAYALLGVLVGIAAFLYVGKHRNVEMTVASGMSLEAIAAAVIGGTSILGGEGSVIGCVIGVFFIRLLQNGLVLLGIPSIWDYLVLGGLIIAAILSDLLYKRRRT